MKTNQILLTIILVIVIGVGAFVGGIKYQQNKRPTFNRQNVPNNRQAGFRPINGEIIASTDKSITVKLTDGGSKIILFSNSTTF